MSEQLQFTIKAVKEKPESKARTILSPAKRTEFRQRKLANKINREKMKSRVARNKGYYFRRNALTHKHIPKQVEGKGWIMRL